MPLATLTFVFLTRLSLADQLYTDKNRFFSFISPPQWSMVEAKDDPRTKVTFSTLDASLIIIAYRPMKPASLEQMEANVIQSLSVLEKRIGARIKSVRRLEFSGREAIESLFEAGGQQNWQLYFFLPKQVFVTASLTAHGQTFNIRLNEAKASLSTLVPIDGEVSLGEIKNQAIVRLLNRAKTEIELLKRYDEAENTYGEVLQLDPVNAAALSGLENLKKIRDLNSGK